MDFVLSPHPVLLFKFCAQTPDSDRPYNALSTLSFLSATKNYTIDMKGPEYEYVCILTEGKICLIL